MAGADGLGKTLRRINVQPLPELLRLAASVRPKRLHFVSSAAVSYLVPGTGEITEAASSADCIDRIQLPYARSKWVGERLVADQRTAPLGASATTPASTSVRSVPQLGGDVALDFLPQLGPGLLDESPAQPLAHGLVLLLLLRVEQRHDLVIDAAGDLPQLLDFVHRAQRGIVLQRLQIRYFFLQQGQNLLFLLFRQAELTSRIGRRG